MTDWDLTGTDKNKIADKTSKQRKVAGGVVEEYPKKAKAGGRWPPPLKRNGHHADKEGN